MSCVRHGIDLADSCPNLSCPVCKAQVLSRCLRDFLLPAAMLLPILWMLLR